MVMHPPAQYPVQTNQPTTVVVTQATHVAVPQAAGCNCSVPANVSSAVKATRKATIAIIIIHAICLAAWGFILWSQWVASLMAIISGSVLLCQFTKCSYTAAAVLYIIGFINDIVSIASWIVISNAVDTDSDDYYGDGGGDDDYSETIGWLALPPALGAISLLVGLICAFMAICNWDKSGAPDVTPALHGGVQVHHPAPAYPNVAHQTPQYAVSANKGAPPAYTSTV